MHLAPLRSDVVVEPFDKLCAPCFCRLIIKRYGTLNGIGTSAGGQKLVNIEVDMAKRAPPILSNTYSA